MTETYLEKAEHLVRNHPVNKELMEFEHIDPTDKYQDIDKKLNEIQKILLHQSYTKEALDTAGFIVDAHNKQHRERYAEEIIFRLKEDLSTPHLEHYLRVLGEVTKGQYCLDFNDEIVDGELSLWVMEQIEIDKNEMGEKSVAHITFNLTTGRPATEGDAKEFIKLVSNHD